MARLNSITPTGTNLNTPLTVDLSKATNIYNQEISPTASTSLLGDIISFVGNTISIAVDALMNALVALVGGATELLSTVKNKILGFIQGLLGVNLGSLSKMSLFQKTNLRNSSANNCNLNGLNLGLNDFNLNILGYGLASLLAMLLCMGINGIFSTLSTIINLGLVTLDVVGSALSDVFANVFGGNTVSIVNDLAGSQFSGAVRNVNNSESMILNFLNKNTQQVSGNARTAYSDLSGSLDTLTPNWLNNGGNFSLSKVRGNNTISGLAQKSLLTKQSAPLISSNNYTSKVLSSTEKVGLLSKIF